MAIHRCDRVRRRALNLGGWEIAVLSLLILVPIGFNAILLRYELWGPTPPSSDDALHYMFVRQASRALANGDNPFDFWVPNLGLGFPQFHYYQHLPHLAVVLLHRLLLQQVDLLKLFNVVRYLLLVLFPLTVYWSMRIMEFSAVSAAMGAAGASLLSAGHRRYGFEYESYLSTGSGMYTQLWAMHLFFISLACVQRLLRKGTGYAATVVACSALVLSHLLYACMAALTALVLVLVNLGPQPPSGGEECTSDGAALPSSATGFLERVRKCMIRVAIVAVLSAAITSYFWLPFLLLEGYFNWVQPAAISHTSSFGHLRASSAWQLVDYGRAPVLTVLLGVGAAYAVFVRTAPARLALAIFLFWAGLYFGLFAAPILRLFVPMHETVPVARLVGGVDLGAILLVGLGGEWLWRQAGWLPEPWRAVVPGLVILALIIPALRERLEDYARGTRLLERSAIRVRADAGLPRLIARLHTLPPGRTYYREGAVVDGRLLSELLMFYGVVTTSHGQHLSLNSLLKFDPLDPKQYNLLNVRYVLEVTGWLVPGFLTPINGTRSLTLYRAETNGFAQFVATRPGAISSTRITEAERNLFQRNQEWLQGGDAATDKFIRWQYPPGERYELDAAAPGGPSSGRITEERVFPDRIDLKVDCEQEASLLIKVTYHPNWRVTIDGKEQATFMLSPSYLGVEVPPGHHEIHAEYRSSLLKKLLLVLGICTLVGTIALRRRLSLLEASALSPARSLGSGQLAGCCEKT